MACTLPAALQWSNSAAQWPRQEGPTPVTWKRGCSPERQGLAQMGAQGGVAGKAEMLHPQRDGGHRLEK